ncbi:Iron-sulfur cluster repair protein YtfE, RIC family, contains ScdAN and hemerythrin domains [Fodinibius roseus]|uniref:Iron-sulfur cluster repair protein YtfE, RIC family, contains ScdAN and hemerythrin domains n=1 Tax=Fodinibius roseus TaxID=1194090 RepID=A0A1M5EJX0_9BACT|nr:hypothetical protein [Fodinibius roseus]SHF79593.1 Iron-sulfur cluster repair protein YtfE, RIC family, contains ScdAN and hemerythrin domains [Fodinibius roseus]
MKKIKQSLDHLTPGATLSQIASAHRRVNDLLRSIGLDPSSRSDETLRAVCQQRQWNESEVLHWIREKTLASYVHRPEEVRPEEPERSTNLTKWCEYISEGFHPLNIELLNEIADTFPRVAKVHGNQYPRLKYMCGHFKRFSGDLELYFKFQSKKLFPLAGKLDDPRQQLLDGTIRKLEQGIRIVEKDQQRLLQLMEILREKGHQLGNPKDATFRILNQHFKMLEEQLKKQFNVGKKIIIPLIQQKLGSI